MPERAIDVRQAGYGRCMLDELAGTNQYSVTVSGDVRDSDQARLRRRDLFCSGHVGMSRTGNIREGSCDTTFDVFGDSSEAARELVERELGAERILAITRVP